MHNSLSKILDLTLKTVIVLTTVFLLFSYLFLFRYYIIHKSYDRVNVGDTIIVTNTVTKIVTKIDTVYRERVVPKVIALTKLDSVYFTDTVYVKETNIQQDTSYVSTDVGFPNGDSVYVTYYFPPHNFFDVKLKCANDLVVMPIYDRSCAKSFTYGAVTGIVVGAVSSYIIIRSLRR